MAPLTALFFVLTFTGPTFIQLQTNFPAIDLHVRVMEHTNTTSALTQTSQ